MNLRRLFRAVLCTIVGVTAVTAQEWRPWARWPTFSGCMVLDEADGRVSVFDYFLSAPGAGQDRNQLLQWNGTAFWPRPSGVPSGWIVWRAAYERITQRLFVIASPSGATVGNSSIWAYDGASWSQLPLPGALASFASQVLVQDPTRGQLAMLHMSSSPVAAPVQLWHFDGVGWTQAVTPGAPLVFGQVLATADTARNRIVMLTGGTHYEWNGTQWRSVASQSGTALAYDSRRQRVVANQGQGLIAEYDGVAWTLINASGPNGYAPANSFVFDPLDGETLALVPPLSGGTPSLWSWNGARWLQRGSPDASRNAFEALHDPTRGRMLGVREAAAGFDLATWEGDRWQTLSSGVSAWRMAFDPTNQRVVASDRLALYTLTGSSLTPLANYPNSIFPFDVFAFLGDPAGTLLNAGAPLFGPGFVTATYAGGAFTILSPQPVQPSQRDGARGAYHAASGGVVLFGGFASNGAGPLGDTWVFRNGAWSQAAPVHAPPPRGVAWMAADTASGNLLLGGGTNGPQDRLDMWSWDGADWQPRPEALPWSRGSVAFDPVRGAMTLVNGFSLAFLSSQLPTVAAIGQGCGGGSLGVPTLRALGDPAIGNDTFALRVGRAAAGTLAFVMLDVSSAAIPIGGCTLYLPSPVTHSVRVADALNGSTFALSVPFVPALRGMDLYAQGGTIDFAPGALFGEYSLTGALAMRIGD